MIKIKNFNKVSTVENSSNQTPSDERNNHLIGMIGTNRTGKTSIAIELAKLWRTTHPNQEVIVFDPQRKFIGVKTLDIDPTNHSWEDDLLRYKNSLIILDDYRLIHPSNQASDGLMRLMHFRSEFNIDIVYITHTPALVLNLLTGYTTQYYIFLTNVQQGSFERKIPCYEQCMAASQIVNRYVVNNKDRLEKGRFHLTADGPRFPHCVVDTDTLEVKAFNMNQGNI